jgi:2-haloacid dehalogenase
MIFIIIIIIIYIVLVDRILLSLVLCLVDFCFLVYTHSKKNTYKGNESDLIFQIIFHSFFLKKFLKNIYIYIYIFIYLKISSKNQKSLRKNSKLFEIIQNYLKLFNLFKISYIYTFFEKMTPDIPDSMTEVKAFFYDVFGTIVDWRTTLTQELSSFATLTSTRISNQTLLNKDWHSFTQKWRNGYKLYINSSNLEKAPFLTVDSLNKQILEKLIMEFDIIHLWSDDELENLVNLWHNLDPYKDTIPGINRLGEKYINGVLSNANVKLLVDLKRNADLNCFDFMFSAEFWKCYIPNSKIYLDCCKMLNLRPEQVAIVSHIKNDLKNAKKLGLKTVLVQREDYCDDEEENDEHIDYEEETNGFGGQANHEFDLIISDFEELAQTMAC